MVHTEEKRARLADALARRQGATSGVGASTPSAPIAAIPLATAQASPMLTPLGKGKCVVAIDSDDDEDTGEGVVFKRRKVVVAVTSHSSTEVPPSSYREQPPSASSPHKPLTIEGGGESAPEGAHVPPAPELPPVL